MILLVSHILSQNLNQLPRFSVSFTSITNIYLTTSAYMIYFSKSISHLFLALHNLVLYNVLRLHAFIFPSLNPSKYYTFSQFKGCHSHFTFMCLYTSIIINMTGTIFWAAILISETWLCHLLAAWPWANQLIFLNLIIFMYEILCLYWIHRFIGIKGNTAW